jgi:hypothetical protein
MLTVLFFLQAAVMQQSSRGPLIQQFSAWQT